MTRTRTLPALPRQYRHVEIELSLVKRAADLVLGVPGLIGWQMLEWGRLVPTYREQPVREGVDPRSRSH